MKEECGLGYKVKELCGSCEQHGTESKCLCPDLLYPSLIHKQNVLPLNLLTGARSGLGTSSVTFNVLLLKMMMRLRMRRMKRVRRLRGNSLCIDYA
jgi:hypothetical protein